MREPQDLKRKAPRAAGKKNAAAVDEIVAVLRAFSVGQYGGRVDLVRFEGTPLQEVAKAVNATADHVEAEIREARQRIDTVSAGVDEAIDAMVRLVIQGDLSGSLRLGVADAALTPLIAGVGQVMETLKKFVTEIREAALQLSTSSAEVLAAATQNESSTSAQASAIHETTATMEELKGASHQIAENAQMVAGIAEQTLSSARTGEGAIKEFMQSMENVRRNAIEVDDAI